MPSGNISFYRTTFANLAAATYFYPNAAGMSGDGFDHLSVRLQLVSGDVNNTLTATVESDDGVTGTFAWDESMGMYNWMTGARGTAAWAANNATTMARLTSWNHNARLWRVRLVVAWAVGANHSGIVGLRFQKE